MKIDSTAWIYVTILSSGVNVIHLVGTFVIPCATKFCSLIRKVAKDTDMYYNNHFVMLHDLLRKLALHQSEQEQFEQRKKLIIELNGDDRPEWWVVQNQQGIFGRVLSLLPRWLIEQKQLRVAAQILSISTGLFLSFSIQIIRTAVHTNEKMLTRNTSLLCRTSYSILDAIYDASADENFASDWCDMQADEAEVLVLNIGSSQYSLPQFIEKMSKLKVLILTNYGFHRSELNKFELLSSLSNLKRVRLEKVSVPCLCVLKNLRKLSLHMCNTRQAFDDCSIQISDAMPNLVELSIDYCKDLVKLPDGVCNITPLKKLSITNCHKFSALPYDIAKLKNLEVLRLNSCSDLGKMPESVGGLHNLRWLDISDCVCLTELPEDIGELHSLEKLYMKGCSGLTGLPNSVMNFEHSNHEICVVCDEERAALWESDPPIANIKIETPTVDISLNWLHGVRH